VKARRILIALGLLGGVLVAASPLLADLYTKPIQSVRIAGELRYVSRDALRLVIGPLLEHGFLRMDVADIRAAAMTLPWVKQASVRRVWPDSVHVAVVERKPVARWNSARLLDRDGEVFAPADMAPAPNVPRLKGPAGSETRVLHALEAFQAPLSRIDLRIAGLEHDARGEWRVELRGSVGLAQGVDLALGRGQGAPEIARAVPVIAALMSRHRGRVERIDLRYPQGFAVRFSAGAGQRQG